MSSRLGPIWHKKMTQTVYVATKDGRGCGHQHTTMQAAFNCGGPKAEIDVYLPTNSKDGRVKMP